MARKPNKYGGINDIKGCDKKIYDLWYSMLRRCYDTEVHRGSHGRCYADCQVCDEWFALSNFAKDIEMLENYDLWHSGNGYVIDKDITILGNRTYCKEACRFVTKTENSVDVLTRHPEIQSRGAESRKTPITLSKDGKTLTFKSQSEACDFLGTRADAIATSIYHKCRCRGYEIARV